MLDSQEARRAFMLAACVFFLSFLVAGCSGGGKATSPLSGQVLYRGKPVSEGTVNLQNPTTGIGATADLDSSGKFSVPALDHGTYEVWVTPPREPDPRPDQPAPKVKEYPNIPQKARDPKTSKLLVEVKGDSGEVTLTLD